MITDKREKEGNINVSGTYIYKDLTYKIIGCCYKIHKVLGCIHKEIIYHKALTMEFKDQEISFDEEKYIDVKYKGKTIGSYRPDFIVDDKVIVEIKVASMITKDMMDQVYFYVKGTPYQVVLLVNFGTKKMGIKRLIYT